MAAGVQIPGARDNTHICNSSSNLSFLLFSREEFRAWVTARIEAEVVKNFSQWSLWTTVRFGELVPVSHVSSNTETLNLSSLLSL